MKKQQQQGQPWTYQPIGGREVVRGRQKRIETEFPENLPEVRAPPPRRSTSRVGRLGKGKQIGQPAPGSSQVQEIARFIAEGMGNECQITDPTQITDFLQRINDAEWNGIDVLAILDVAHRQGRIPIKFSRKGRKTGASSKGFRTAGLAFTGRTVGPARKGNETAAEVILPSLMWEILAQGCRSENILAVLNGIMDEIQGGEYGLQPVNLDELPVGTPEETVRNNRGLAAFIESHPYCSANREDIEKFLNLVHSTHISGSDIFAMLRVLYLEGVIEPGIPRSGYRMAGLELTPRTLPTAGTKLDREGKGVVYSFLWYVLENYCQRMPEILTFAYNVLREGAQQGAQQGRQQGGQQAGKQGGQQQMGPGQ